MTAVRPSGLRRISGGAASTLTAEARAKRRAFSRATLINISAEEPEVVFLEQGRAAVMRFRKRYRIDGGPRSGRGEVVQELRWRKTDEGWKIVSERDVRVIN